MIITFFSFYMAIIWSSFFIALIYFFRKRFFSINFISVSGIVLIYLFCVVRIGLPFEMPYTIIIWERGLYNRLTQLMNRMVGIGNFQCRVSFLLLGVWLIVAVVFSIHFLHDYYRYKSVIVLSCCQNVVDGRLAAMIDRVGAQKGKRGKVKVLIGDSIKTPKNIGIFKPCIVLPQKEYSDEKAFYILLHEYTHLWNGDPTVKLLINILQCIFWWNPFIYLLRRDLEQILEIKCDLTVMKQLGIDKKKDYLNTIIETIKESGCCFSKSLVDIEERFRVVSKYENIKGEKIKKNLLYIMAVIMLCLSYSFVIQPKFDAPIADYSIDTDTHKLDISENYILIDSDGNYWLVLGNQEKTQIDEPTAIKMMEAGFQAKEEVE